MKDLAKGLGLLTVGSLLSGVSGAIVVVSAYMISDGFKTIFKK